MTTATANSSLWPFIRDAAMTLVRAIIEPIERSIPPEMTTIAWATAASASGSDRDREALDARAAP